MKRGEVYYAELSPVYGSEQGGMRPVLIIQNNVGNKHSATTIIAPMTTRAKVDMPTHVKAKLEGIDNIILLEQIRGISRNRLISRVGKLDNQTMEKVDEALKVSLALE